MKKGVGKKGLSEIVTTILFVLLALGAVILVWMLVRPIITKSGEQIISSQECLNLEVEATKCSYDNSFVPSVLYKRGSNEVEFNVSKINLVFTMEDGTSVTQESSTIANPLEIVNAGITEALPSAPKDVAVVAVLKDSNGKESVCSLEGARKIICLKSEQSAVHNDGICEAGENLDNCAYDCAYRPVASTGCGANLFLNSYLFYVAVNGNDAGDGSFEKPFATLERARDATRTLKAQKGGVLDKPVVVYLRDGTYRLNKTFELKGGDSGEKCAPVVYSSYPGESAVISSGKTLSAEWEDYENNPNVKVANISDFLRENKLTNFRDLFVNGKMAVRARTPNEGSYYRTNPTPNGLWSFGFNNAEISSSWTNLKQVEVVVFWSWLDQHQHIDYVNETNKSVWFIERAQYEFNRSGAKYPYFVENVFEGLDSEGEWYFNNNTEMLYYYPYPGEDISDSTIEIPLLKNIFYVNNDNNYEIVNGATYTSTEGHDGKGAYEFDGFDDYISAGNPSSLNNISTELTVSFWINPKSWTKSGDNKNMSFFVNKYQYDSGTLQYGWHVNQGYSGNKLSMSIYGSQAFASVSAPNPPLNTWTQVTAVYKNGTALSIYYNGILNASGANKVLGKILPTAYNLEIGRRSGTTGVYSAFVNGIIDDVQIWDKSLSAEEILTIYQRAVNGEKPTDELVAKYSFDDSREGNRALPIPHDIIIQNLSFSESASEFVQNANTYATTPSIFFTCVNCTFRNNLLFNLESRAMGARIDGSLIERNHFFDLGSSGLSLSQLNSNNVANRNFVIDNQVNDYGKIIKFSSGIKISDLSNTFVSFNEVYNAPYLGIMASVGNFTGSVITGNNVHNVMQELQDGGGIYTNYGHDLVIRENKVHDLHSTYPSAENINGIYFDANVLHCAATNNLIYNVARAGILVQIEIINNSFVNNIIVNTEYPLRYNPYWSSTDPGLGYGEGNKIIRNIAFNSSRPIYYGSNFNTNYTSKKTGESQSVMEFYKALINFSDYNLFYNPSGWSSSAVSIISDMQTRYGWDNNSIFDKDPLFVDYGAGDFTLQPDSPAYALGFEPFVIKAGMRPPRAESFIVCGNRICEAGETAETCSADCA